MQKNKCLMFAYLFVSSVHMHMYMCSYVYEYICTSLHVLICTHVHVCMCMCVSAKSNGYNSSWVQYDCYFLDIYLWTSTVPKYISYLTLVLIYLSQYLDLLYFCRKCCISNNVIQPFKLFQQLKVAKCLAK